MKSENLIFKIDAVSFRVIYDLYFEPVCAFLSYYTRDKATVEDVVQDVFVSLWENKDFLEIQYLKTFIYSVARNRMLNYLRNTGNRSVLLNEWMRERKTLESSTECYDMEEFSKELKRAVDLLPDRCKEIFILHKEKRLTYHEIAEFCHISVKTVETQMSIALKRIRKSITTFLTIYVL